MGLLDNVREFVASRDQNRIAETRVVDASDFGFAVSLNSGNTPDAGEGVTVESAMRAAMGACIRLLADDIGTLPWHAYRKLPDDSRERIAAPAWMEYPEGHRWSTPESHVTDAVVSLLSNGNLFVEGNPNTIVPTALAVLPPERVAIRRGEDGFPRYDVEGVRSDLTADKIAHVPWIRLPGTQRGLDMVEQAREFTGVELAARRWLGNFFANGATLGGVIEFPQSPRKMSWDELQVIRRSFDERHRGNKNSHITGFLTNGAHWEDTSVGPNEAALDPLWSHVLEEAARFYHIPTHLLASTDGSNVGSNVEQRSIEYVVHAVVPVVNRLETMYSRLLPGADTFIKFNVAALLRGDHKTRAEANAIELTHGVITRDEWRSREDYGPAPDGEGGYLRTPNSWMTDVRIEDASKLIRAGFDPNEALAFVGLDPSIKHLGFSPTTQYELESEESGSTEGTPAEDTQSQRHLVELSVGLPPGTEQRIADAATTAAQAAAEQTASQAVGQVADIAERFGSAVQQVNETLAQVAKSIDTASKPVESRIERDASGRAVAVYKTRGGKTTRHVIKRDADGNAIGVEE